MSRAFNEEGPSSKSVYMEPGIWVSKMGIQERPGYIGNQIEKMTENKN